MGARNRANAGAISPRNGFGAMAKNYCHGSIATRENAESNPVPDASCGGRLSAIVRLCSSLAR